MFRVKAQLQLFRSLSSTWAKAKGASWLSHHHVASASYKSSAPIMAATLRTNLDLTNDIDSFPYESSPEAHSRLRQELYTLIWRDEQGELPVGYMPTRVLEKLVDAPIDTRGEIQVDREKRVVSAFQLATEKERTEQIAKLTSYWRENDVFPALRGWRDELWPIYGRNGQLLYDMERSATGLFGVMRYGVHMTAYTRSPDASHGIKMWVAKRSPTKSTFPNMLDNTAAGGLMTGEDPFECIIREANEEADLPEDLVRDNTESAGEVTYVYITHKEAGEAGLIYPEVQWIYDLELPENVTPVPKDGEVAGFSLCTVEEVKQQLAQGLFKPNCALVVIDFFIRRGILTKDNEADFDEINRRIHRKLPFPGPSNLDPLVTTIGG